VAREVEQGLLGALIACDDGVVCQAVYDQLSEEDFVSPRSREIFGTLRRLRTGGSGRVDLKLLAAEVASTGDIHPEEMFELLGGEYAPLSCLPSEIPSYVRWLLKARVRRALRGVCAQVVRDLDSGHQEPQAAAQALQRAIDEGTATLTTDHGVRYEDALERGVRRSAEKGRYLSTGIPELDAKIGGFGPGELIVLAARPYLGKTVLTCNIAARMARETPVEYWTLEMDSEEIARIIWQAHNRRTIPDFFGIVETDSEELDRHVLSLRSGHENLRQITLHEGVSTVEDLVARMTQAVRARGSKVIFVDNLNLLGSSGAKGLNRAQEMAIVSRRLKLAAKDLQVALVCIAHLNRGIEAREGHKPKLSDLRDSGTIEQDADAVLFLHSESYFKGAQVGEDSRKPKFLRLYAEKRRGAGKSVTKLIFRPHLTRFDGHESDDSSEFR
jgi:replicative DNA helicase